jgi:hypothetical protein
VCAYKRTLALLLQRDIELQKQRWLNQRSSTTDTVLVDVDDLNEMSLTYAMDPSSAGADAFHDVSSARTGAKKGGKKTAAAVTRRSITPSGSKRPSAASLRVSPRTRAKEEVEQYSSRRHAAVGSSPVKNTMCFNAATGKVQPAMTPQSSNAAVPHLRATTSADRPLKVTISTWTPPGGNQYARPRPLLPSLSARRRPPLADQ